MLTAAKEETFSASSDPCALFPLAAAEVYPKTRVWGSKPESVHCSSATAPLKIELRWGCGESSEKTAVGSGVSFKYDPFGRRIEKTTSSTTSIYAYSDNGNLIEETNAAGGVVARYSQGLNIDEPLAMLRSSTTSYYEADGLGAVTSLSNTAGALAQTYTFDSFGNTTASSGSLVNPFQYTGRELDSETGLYYFRARYFDPQAGRFLGEDPLGFSVDVNFYRYVGNSPTNFNDPLGLAKCEYSISQHTLVCTSNYSPPVGPTYYVTVGPNNVSSGNGECKDNPKCADKQFTGPIKPGNYKMNPDTRQGQTDRCRLEPNPRSQDGKFVCSSNEEDLSCILAT